MNNGMSYEAPQQLRAVILDWAGVTVDFGSRAPVVAMLAAFDRLGVSVTEQEVRAYMGKAKKEHLAAVLAIPRVHQAWVRAHGHPAADEDLDRIYESFLRLQQECIAAHSDVISGCHHAVDQCRQKGLRIGSSTGYTRELLEPAAGKARREGYEPDVVLCADDVSPGRPAPWLCFENARRLDVYPMSTILKVDDTPAGVMAGRNAGAWAVGVVVSGNQIGLTEPDWKARSPEEQAKLRGAAGDSLHGAGAHLLIDTIADLPGAVDQINQWILSGQTPLHPRTPL